MQMHYLVIFTLAVSLAAVGLIAAYQQFQMKKLRSIVAQLLHILRKDQKESDN